MAIGLISFPQEADPPRVRDSIIRVLVFFFISFATRESEQVGKSFFFLFFIYKKQTEGNIK